jgi:hypothetical protein
MPKPKTPTPPCAGSRHPEQNHPERRNAETGGDKGEVKVTGNGAKLDEMLGYMDKFEFWFNIVTP